MTDGLTSFVSTERLCTIPAISKEPLHPNRDPLRPAPLKPDLNRTATVHPTATLFYPRRAIETTIVFFLPMHFAPL